MKAASRIDWRRVQLDNVGCADFVVPRFEISIEQDPDETEAEGNKESKLDKARIKAPE